MHTLKLHAGDFGDGTMAASEIGLVVVQPVFSKEKPIYRNWDQVTDIEIANEESVKRLGGTVGWGAAGAAVLGPVGLLAGLLLGGRKKEVTFVVRFDDGSKLLGTADAKAYQYLLTKSGAF